MSVALKRSSEGWNRYALVSLIAVRPLAKFVSICFFFFLFSFLFSAIPHSLGIRNCPKIRDFTFGVYSLLFVFHFFWKWVRVRLSYVGGSALHRVLATDDVVCTPPPHSQFALRDGGGGGGAGLARDSELNSSHISRQILHASLHK